MDKSKRLVSKKDCCRRISCTDVDAHRVIHQMT